MTNEDRILDKLDRLSDDIYELKVGLSKLPHEFVSRAELRRITQWLVATGLAVVGLGIQVWIAL